MGTFCFWHIAYLFREISSHELIQHDRNFADDIWNLFPWMITGYRALVQIMVWCRTGDEALFKSRMDQSIRHVYVYVIYTSFHSDYLTLIMPYAPKRKYMICSRWFVVIFYSQHKVSAHCLWYICMYIPYEHSVDVKIVMYMFLIGPLKWLLSNLKYKSRLHRQ